MPWGNIDCSENSLSLTNEELHCFVAVPPASTANNWLLLYELACLATINTFKQTI
jgi:hypothetical protein